MPGMTANLPNGSADHLDPDGWLKHFFFEVARTNKIRAQDTMTK